MATPKTQIKVIAKDGKTEVKYESNLDATQYYIYELCRAALRDVGKFVAKTFKAMYYQHFEKHTGKAGKATKYKVISGSHTMYPRVQIGVKTGQVEGFYAYFQEMGSSKQRKLGLLTHAVQDNVAEIVKIQSQYLSGLEGEASRLDNLISESDYDGDGDT